MYRQLPKVSVVTITYGHQDYILETIKGVLMQDYSGEIEFIIANDNSPDDTHLIVTEFLNVNSIPPRFQIKYTKHDKNLGMMQNFIWALSQSKGKYIALCEGDDYWTDPLKLQKQVDFLEENHDFSLCVGGFTSINEYSKKTSTHLISLNKDLNAKGFKFTLDDTMNQWLTKTLTAVFLRNEKVLSQIKNYSFFRDIHLFYLILNTGNGFYFNEILGCYRIHEGGVNSMKQGEVNNFNAYNVYRELYLLHNDNWTRIMFLKSTAHLLNFYIYNSFEKKSIYFKFKLYKQIISLISQLEELKFLISPLISEKLKSRYRL